MRAHACSRPLTLALIATSLVLCTGEVLGQTDAVVARLTLEGVDAVDEAELRGVLQTRQRGWLPWDRPQPYDPAAFDADLRRIESFYAARGYPDARVVDSDVTHDERRQAVFLRVVVEEGDPVLVSGVEFTGFEALPAPQVRWLREETPLRQGAPLDTADREATGQLALRALWDAGFAFAQLEVRETQEAPRQVRVEFRADPGNRAIFGAVDISGHHSVDDGVIRRYVAYVPGEAFQVRAIEETQRRLLGLGLFSDVRIEAVPEDVPAPVRTRIMVEEGDHRRIDFSVGYATEAQVHADVQLSHVNFLGGARTAMVHGRASWLDRGIQGAFLQPYLLRPDLSLRLDGHLWFMDQRRYEVLSRGGRATLQYQPAPRLATHAMFLNEFTTTQLPDDALADPGLVPVAAPAIDPFTGRQRGLLSAIEVGANWNATEGAVEPVRGYALSARVEQAGGWLPGSFNYASVLGEARGYLSGAGGLVLAQRVRYGSISPFGPQSDVPFFRRYFLGGADSLRGWGRFELAPLSPAGVPVGGHALFESATELRFPLVPRFGGVVFLDAGNVWAPAGTLRLGDLRYAAGAGIRFASPFGPVRLDAGYQLTPVAGLRIDGEPQERRWRLHFSVVPPF